MAGTAVGRRTAQNLTLNSFKAPGLRTWGKGCLKSEHDRRAKVDSLEISSRKPAVRTDECKPWILCSIASSGHPISYQRRKEKLGPILILENAK